MKLNNKGFAISSIVYSILLLFLILIFAILTVLGSRKLVLDKVKNTVMNKLNGEATTSIYKDNSGANAPELYDKMIPVLYDGYNWIYADASKKWYDYDNKEWANAVVLVNSPSKAYNVGDNILMEDIGMMYVWIPRYKYTIFNGNNGLLYPQEIVVKFEGGVRKTGTVSCVDAINQTDSSGNAISEICTDNKNGNVINGISTYTHPAFTFGGKELAGIWVGKFDASTSNTTCITTPSAINCNNEDHTIKVIPNVDSLRWINVSNLFTSVLNIKMKYNMNDVNSHMIKNTEWGAIAYLSQSRYGRCTNGVCEEVSRNGIWNNKFHTGCLGSYSDQTCRYEYNTTEGVKVSTTGNIYGVYDMAGGANEYVMGNQVNSGGQFYSGLGGFESVPEAKYYDLYTYDGSEMGQYRVSRGKLGDSTKEVLADDGDGGQIVWHSDAQDFVNINNSWFVRGGAIYDMSPFYFYAYDGNSEETIGTRSIIVKD